MQSIPQDSSIQASPIAPGQISTSSMRMQINLERVVVVDSVSRKQGQMIADSLQKAKYLRVEKPVKPAVEWDSAMLPHVGVGCVKPVGFPNTLPLTALERYFQSGAPDSLMAPQPIIARTEQSFTGFSGISREAGYPSVITILLILSLLFFTWIKFRFGKNIRQAFYSYFNYQQSCKMFAERRNATRQASFCSNILFSYNGGILVALTFSISDFPQLWGSYVLSILFFSAVIGFLYLFKAGMLNLLGYVFVAQDLSQEYVHNMFIYNRNLGIFLLPVITAIPFIAPGTSIYLVYTAIGLVCLSCLLKTFRTFQIIRARNIPAFYFILYLCTLEILPVLVLLKISKFLISCLFV